MTPRETLILLETLTGKTQADLARQFGVSFAAYSRWRNGHAQPRTAKLELIRGALSTHLGTAEVGKQDTIIQQALVNKQREHPHLLKEIVHAPDILQQFVLSLTYNSNRIEGSTLSEAETASVLFDNTTPRNKTVTEVLEARNHRTALEHLFLQLEKDHRITERLVCRLHEILMNSIRDDAGMYRTHAVRIVGAYVPTANHLKIPALMHTLVRAMQSTPKNIVAHLAHTHAQFEQVHPFSDGNGRVGRLLMHAIALRANMPPVLVEQRRKREYLQYLNKAQLEGDYEPLENFLGEALLRGYAIVERKL